MKNIAIYGAGGFGREVACVLRRINEKTPIWRFIGFFDDGKEEGDRNEYGNILGGICKLNQWEDPLDIIVAIGSSSVRRSVVDKIENEKINYPNLFLGFSCADVNNYSIGKGNIVLDTYFSCNVTVGDFNVFNSGIVLGHDALVGSYNTFMPATRVSGDVYIGDRNFFGIASIILQKIKIGLDVRVGAGSVLMRNPKDGHLYIGNPAKIFKC